MRAHFGRYRIAPELYRDKATDPGDRLHAAACVHVEQVPDETEDGDMMIDVDTVRAWEPPIPTDPENVRLVLVSECAAADPDDDYGASDESLFDTTTLEAFTAAGLHAKSIDELREYGIHLTVAIRHPKTSDRISATTVSASVPVLAEELALFPHARVYLLMGDVAIAALNQLSRTRHGKRAIPAGSTYRIRDGEYFLDGIRLFPSYLQAGPAWYVEASKRKMIAEDITAALTIAGVPALDD